MAQQMIAACFAFGGSTLMRPDIAEVASCVEPSPSQGSVVLKQNAAAFTMRACCDLRRAFVPQSSST